jgi:ribosomal peptide maturation radical SAM protein 1
VTRRSLAVVSTPWKAADTPSLQLAVLASWVRQHVPEIPVSEEHHYLEIAGLLGDARYQRLGRLIPSGSDRVSLPEAFYAALLFPSERARIAAEVDALYPWVESEPLLASLEACTALRAQEVAAAKHGIVGISVSFFQTFSSLYFANILRGRDPECLIVLGGPEVPGEVGASILRAFSFVDFVVGGEGETPIQRMAETLRDQPAEQWRASIAAIDGVLTRASVDVRGDGDRFMPQGPTAKPVEIRDLDQLPIPTFDAYFDQLPPSLDDYPRFIPIETSRGCFWDRSNVNPLSSCAFCNLNATWSSYREKSAERAIREMTSQRSRYGRDDVMVVDNILRQGAGLEPYLHMLETDGRGARLILEAKASLKPTEFARLRAAGIVEMQLGVEALSNGILKRLVNKGTTVLHNLQALRWMDDLGIVHAGNLILGYPGTSAEELRETLKNIELASVYQPLFPGEFWLGYYSPMYRVPEVFGLTGIRNRKSFDGCLPEALRSEVFSLGKDCDFEMTDEVRDLWTTVKFRLDLDRIHYRHMKAKYGVRSLLVMDDRGDSLELTDYREDPPRRAVLDGPARALYLRMTTARTDVDLVATAAPGFDTLQLLGALDEQRLVYRERGRSLALAVSREERVPPPYLDLGGERAAVTSAAVARRRLAVV